MADTFDILLKTINVDKNKTDEICTVFSLYEKIKVCEKFHDIYKELKDFFLNFYKIHHIKASIYDTKSSSIKIIEHNGKEFNSSDILAYKYTMKIDDEKKLNFALCFDNVDHKEENIDSIESIDFLFYLIDPIIKTSFIIDKLDDASFKDNITDVYNRTFMDAHLKKLIPLAKRESKNIAFLVVGIDHFKAVIDEFDYAIGDKVLIELAKVLKECVRESDLVVRLNSDEFLVILTNVDSSDSAIKVGEKLTQAFSKIEVDVNSYTGQTLKKTICVGLSMFPEDSTSIDQILKNADIALYEAKNKGRSKVLKYDNDASASIELF